jgi:spermidine synthase
METSTTDLEEVVYEESETYSEIISSSTYAYQMVETIDTVMLSNEEKEMVSDIKRMALKLVHFSLKSIYEVNIEE